MSFKMKFWILLILIGYCRSEVCTFLDTLNYSTDLLQITIQNVPIPKLCTNIEIYNNINSYGFVKCGIKELGIHLFNKYKVTEIMMSQNLIKTLYSYTFYKINVNRIVLTSNEIEAIEDNAFISLENLSYLSLQNNKIKILNPKAFNQLIHLNEFYMQNNKLSFLSNNSFHFMESNNFKIMHFSTNELTVIEPFCFKDINISMLMLDNNPLNSLNESSFINVYTNILYLQGTKINELNYLCEYELFHFNHYYLKAKEETCSLSSFNMVIWFFLASFLGIINVTIIVIIFKRFLEK